MYRYRYRNPTKSLSSASKQVKSVWTTRRIREQWFLLSLDAKAGSTATLFLGIRVEEFESTADEFFGIVELKSIQKEQRLGVDDTFDSILGIFVNFVVLIDIIFRRKVHHIAH